MDINIFVGSNHSCIESYIFIDNDTFDCFVVPIIEVKEFLLKNKSKASGFTVLTNKTELKKCLNLNIFDCEVL